MAKEPSDLPAGTTEAGQAKKGIGREYLGDMIAAEHEDASRQFVGFAKHKA